MTHDRPYAGYTRDERARSDVAFSPLEGILSAPVPYGTAWNVHGDAGIGKTIFAFQFSMQALRRGESVVFVCCDEDPRRVEASLSRFGFAVSPYVEAGQLLFVDAFSETQGEQFTVSDRTDAEELLFVIGEAMRSAGKPLRMVVDSITSLSAYYSERALVHMVHEKNRLLRCASCVLLDLYLREPAEAYHAYSLSNAYDVTMELYYGDEQGGFPRRSLRVRKVRGGTFDPRAFPFRIEPHEGIVVDRQFYSK